MVQEGYHETAEENFASICEEIISCNPGATKVDVGSIDFPLTDHHVRLLAYGIKMNTCDTLTHVHLRNVQSKRNCTISRLAAAIRSHSGVSDLTISDCESGCPWECLGLALSCNSTLKGLVMSNCFRSTGEAQAVASLLNMSKSLTEIRLCHNSINSRSARGIARALRSSKTVRVLDLTGNKMNDAATRIISRALHHHSSLLSFTLDFNLFGDDGVKALSLLLQNNHTLQDLQLFGNKVSATGAIFLSEGLRRNRGLRSLVLSFNRIGDKGASALGESLTVNTTLTKVWFPSNAVSLEGIVSFAKHLPQMRGLSYLDIGMLLDDEAAKALESALQFNVSLNVLKIEKMPPDDSEESSASQMDFYLRLNRGGRRVFLEHELLATKALWPYVLEKANQNSSPCGAPDVLYHLLRITPDLLWS